MEEVLNGLLLPNSEAIKAASAQLKAALQADSGKAVAELCQIMATSQTPQVLTYTRNEWSDMCILCNDNVQYYFSKS